MAVGLEVDFLWYPIGAESFVHSFFSTICYNLENCKWGSRFPYIMGNLYQGELQYSDVSKALEEIEIIRDELKQFPPQKVIWDIDDMSKRPPWGDVISAEITDLSNYFVTCDGEDIFDELFKAFNESVLEEQNILLVKLG